MSRSFRRLIACALLSVSIVAATVSASYGEGKLNTKTARNTFNVAWRPGT